MSCWTHITACLSVETGLIAKKPELKRLVKQYIKDAPKITGSEENATLYVNVQSSYNFFMSRDCEHCKYKATIKEFQDENGDDVFECDGPEKHDCSAHYQSCVVISIQGDLRDRLRDQTQREFNNFLEYIEKKYYVRDYALNIEGDY